MHQENAGGLRLAEHDLQAAKHLVAPGGGIRALGHEEAEHTHALAAQGLAQRQPVAEGGQMPVKGLIDGRLAIGRPQGR